MKTQRPSDEVDNRASWSLTGFPPAKNPKTLHCILSFFKKNVTIPSWCQLNHKHRYLEVWLVLSLSIHICSLVTCYLCWFYRLRPPWCIINSNPIVTFIFLGRILTYLWGAVRKGCSPEADMCWPSSCQRSGSPTGKCCWSWKGSLEATSAEQIPAERRKPQETRSPLTPLLLPRGEDA